MKSRKEGDPRFRKQQVLWGVVATQRLKRVQETRANRMRAVWYMLKLEREVGARSCKARPAFHLSA